MRAFFQSLLAFVTLGMVPVACDKTEPPGPALDVTLIVPGMN